MLAAKLCPPIIVIGMGHSGTTLISEMLHKGGTPMFAGEVSPDYDDGVRYERLLCTHINTEIFGLPKIPKILEQLWNLPQQPITPEQLDRLYQEVGDQPWGFKDPRTTITYPMWAQAFPDCKTIYVYRQHEEVLRSFYRNRKSLISSLRRLRRSLNAWIHFNRALLQHMTLDEKAGRKAVLVKYGELMQHQSLVGQIERAMEIKVFDARNPQMHRNRIKGSGESLLYRLATIGHDREVLDLYRELDDRRLMPQASTLIASQVEK